MKALIIITLSFYSFLGYSQVAIIDYMFVKPENESKYLELEQKWKQIHRERLKYGTIKGWYLYKVMFSGTDSPYQYVVITVYNNFDDSENLYFEGAFEKAWPNENHEETLELTLNTRKLTKSEVFTYVDGTPIKWDNPAKYLYMNFLFVPEGDENNYIDIERFVWKPIHEELQREMKIASWSLWNLWFYTHTDYRYITMNSFYEYKDLDSYNYSETFQKVHKGQDIQNKFLNTDEARTSVKSELWELVDFLSLEN